MTVKIFRSTDYGAPANTNAIGSVIGILDACLVNGYGAQTPTSVTRSGTTVTVTVPIAHSLKPDTWMRISGANQTEYNGDFFITPLSATSYSYQIATTPASPATGTIVSKVAPVDWTKPFTSGSNIAAYKQGPGSNGMYLKVDDSALGSASVFPKIYGYELMTGDINTTSGAFPTASQITFQGAANGFHKSTTATAQPWIIVASEKCFYAYMSINESYSDRDLHFFGDFPSKKPSDAFNTCLWSDLSNTYGSAGQGSITTNFGISHIGHYIARNHTQLGGSTPFCKFSPSGQTGLGLSGGIPAYPSAIDNALHMAPVVVAEGAGQRGVFPGLWNPLHNKPFIHLDVINGTGDFASKRFICISPGTAGAWQCMLEISNTW